MFLYILITGKQRNGPRHGDGLHIFIIYTSLPLTYRYYTVSCVDKYVRREIAQKPEIHRHRGIRKGAIVDWGSFFFRSFSFSR